MGRFSWVLDDFEAIFNDSLERTREAMPVQNIHPHGQAGLLKRLAQCEEPGKRDPPRADEGEIEIGVGLGRSRHARAKNANLALRRVNGHQTAHAAK